MDVYNGDVGWFDSGWKDFGTTRAAGVFHPLSVTDAIDEALIVELVTKPRSIKIDLPPIGTDGGYIEFYRILLDFQPKEHKCEVYAEVGDCRHWIS